MEHFILYEIFNLIYLFYVWYNNIGVFQTKYFIFINYRNLILHNEDKEALMSQSFGCIIITLDLHPEGRHHMSETRKI